MDGSNNKDSQFQEGSHLPFRTDDRVHDIIGQMPKWIVRYGIVLFGGILLTLFLSTFFISYPDIIPLRVIIRSKNPAVKISAPQTGSIRKIFVENNSYVSRGDRLFIYDNSAKFDQVEDVINSLKVAESESDISEVSSVISNLTGRGLGELQNVLDELIQANDDYLYYRGLNDHRLKLRYLNKEFLGYKNLENNLNNQESKNYEKQKIELESYTIDSALLQAGVLTKKEFRNAKMRVADREINTTTSQKEKIGNRLNQVRTLKEIQQVKFDREVQLSDLWRTVKIKLRNFKSQYRLWEDKYIVKSPTNGKVSLFTAWKDNQFVQIGEGILMVNPEDSEFLVTGIAGLSGAGKIKENQKVLIKLTSYPYEEFGMLSGRVKSFSPVSMDSIYPIEITLDNNLVTLNSKIIPSKAKLTGVGEIITSDKTIFERLFEKLRKKSNHGL